MLFDLTPEIRLGQRDHKRYRLYQAGLYLAAFLAGLYFVYSILFPTQYFVLDYQDLKSGSNTLRPPVTADGSEITDGKMAGKTPVFFNAPLVGNYSDAWIRITLSKDSPLLASGDLKVRWSYKAFLYSEGDPVGFNDGTLLKNGGNHYLISEGKLRKFKDGALAVRMGYPEEAFLGVSADSLGHNPAGEEISDPGRYPIGTLFKIGDDFYALAADGLEKFVSKKAYTSQYNTIQAISQDASFLEKYPLSQTTRGFADGTLVSNPTSVFIVSGENSYPIGSGMVFESMGFNWDDVIPATPEELALYKRTPLFDMYSVHPDGTIFVTEESGDYFIIREGKKHRLPSSAAAGSWNKKNPILVSKRSLDTAEEYRLKKDFWNSRTYSCPMKMAELAGLLGNNYSFQAIFDPSVKIDKIEIGFSKAVDKANLKRTLNNIMDNLRGSYVENTQN